MITIGQLIALVCGVVLLTVYVREHRREALIAAVILLFLGAATGGWRIWTPMISVDSP